MAALRYIAVFVKPPEEDEDQPQGRFVLTAELLNLARELTPRMERVELAEGSGEGLVLEATRRSEPSILQQLSASLLPREDGKGGSPQPPLPLPLWASASTRTAAVLAALNGCPGRLDPKRQQSFLRALPVEVLSLLDISLGPQERQVMQSWGIRSLGHLADLPKGQLAARLGPAGTRLQALSRGEDLRPFQSWTPPGVFQERRDLDWTLDSLEPLSFALQGMLDKLCSRLQSRGLAAEALTLELGLDNGEVFTRTLQLAFPLKSSKVMHSLLRLDLQERPLEAGIHWLAVRLEPVPARTLQFSLLQEAVADPERLSRTLARLTALVGEEKVGCPYPLDTHRPDAFEMRPLRLDAGQSRRKKIPPPAPAPAVALDVPAPVLRRCRPPAPMEIERQQVVHCAGPWHASGDWWRDDHGYQRQQYDVELKDGALLRLFRDPRREGWFLEGVYD